MHTATPLLLLKYLEHPNRWFRRQAALELGWRNERSVLPQLEKLARDPNQAHAFDALTAIDMLGGLRDELAGELLRHPDPYVRRWVIRCAGDDRDVGEKRNATTHLVLERGAAHGDRRDIRVEVRFPAAEMVPAQVRAVVERRGAPHDKRVVEAREQPLHHLLPALQQDVNVPAVRHAFARSCAFSDAGLARVVQHFSMNSIVALR